MNFELFKIVQSMRSKFTVIEHSFDDKQRNVHFVTQFDVNILLSGAFFSFKISIFEIQAIEKQFLGAINFQFTCFFSSYFVQIVDQSI